MSESISEIPWDSDDSTYKSHWRKVLPLTHKNGGFRLESPDGFIRGCYERSNVLTKPLKKRLLRYGLSYRLICQVADYKLSELKRISQFWEGIVTSLLLCEIEMFSIENHKNLHFLFRKVFKVCCYSIGDATKQWKDFLAYLYPVLLNYEVTEKKDISNNVFKRILSWDSFNTVLKLKQTDPKLFLEKVSHLFSSRQLPAASKENHYKSYNKFMATTTRDFTLDDKTLIDIYQSSFKIGEQTRNWSKHAKMQLDTHISMSAAGTFSTSVKDGGRAEEIKKDLIPFLNQVPIEDSTIETPIGSFPIKGGIRLFRSLGRAEILEPDPIDNEVGCEYDFTSYFSEVKYMEGYDEAIGLQILILASIKYKEFLNSNINTIPVKVIMVSEPGFKSRTVTTSPWWVVILQQAPSHIIIERLKCHPSSFAGLSKAEQTWQYQNLLAKHRFPKYYKVLSSDLEEATDNIPWQTARALVTGFMAGLMTGPLPHLVDVGLSLVTTPKEVHSSWGDSFITSRGVFMGEPMTKAILTLFALVAEETAARDSKHPQHLRCFAVGGDDHIAIGPKSYLERISQNMVKMGAKLSATKHGTSSFAVTYCEKIMWVTPMLKGFKLSNKLEGEEFNEWYKTIPYVDSMKIRLLTRASKATFNVNERNMAIGKGKAIASIFRGITGQETSVMLRPTRNSGMFSSTWMRMVRDLFYIRMGPLLPGRQTHLYWHTLLPESTGGLGLALEADFNNIAKNLLPPTVKALRERKSYVGSQFRLPAIVRDQRNFLKNSTIRGFEREAPIVKEIENLIPSLGFFAPPPKSFDEWVTELNLVEKGFSSRMMYHELYRRDIMPIDQAVERIIRPILFLNVMSSKVRAKAFNTEELRKRYKRFWDTYQDVIDPQDKLTASELLDVLKLDDAVEFYDFSIKNSFEDIKGRTYMVSALDQFEIMSPALTIPYSFVKDGSIVKNPSRLEGSAYNENGYLFSDTSPVEEYQRDTAEAD